MHFMHALHPASQLLKSNQYIFGELFIVPCLDVTKKVLQSQVKRLPLFKIHFPHRVPKLWIFLIGLQCCGPSESRVFTCAKLSLLCLGQDELQARRAVATLFQTVGELHHQPELYCTVASLPCTVPILHMHPAFLFPFVHWIPTMPHALKVAYLVNSCPSKKLIPF